MRTRFKLALAVVAATLASTLVIAGVAQAASTPSTPVHLSPAQVAQTLFVAGDVGRLSVIPSGTESVVLEKVLQQLYTNNSALAPSQAVSDIQGLQAALASGSQAISPATLTVMGGNERILAILRALTASSPAPEVQHALARVTDQALTVSEQSTQFLGQSFDASADSLDTLSFSAFSPAGPDRRRDSTDRRRELHDRVGNVRDIPERLRIGRTARRSARRAELSERTDRHVRELSDGEESGRKRPGRRAGDDQRRAGGDRGRGQRARCRRPDARAGQRRRGSGRGAAR